VLVERSLGGAVTLLLAGVGLLLAIGRYPIGPYLWIEVFFVCATLAAGVVFFSRSIRRWLAFGVPLARKLRIERLLRAVYDGIHGVPRPHRHARVRLRGVARAPAVPRLRDLRVRARSGHPPLAAALCRAPGRCSFS